MMEYYVTVTTRAFITKETIVHGKHELAWVLDSSCFDSNPISTVAGWVSAGKLLKISCPQFHWM